VLVSYDEVSMHRILGVALFLGLVVTAAHPEGQRGPTLSDDLKAALASGVPARVIVQGEEDALSTLRLRLGRGLRRQLAGALSLEVSPAELKSLVANAGIAHLSGDLPVVVDASIVNQVTRAETVSSGQRSLIGLLGQPGVTVGGIAPGVHFVDVRVLGGNGGGYTSDVIAGIDWTIANARRYGVRIINLSLGHPIAEPAATDPLCRAVARAVQSGLVVVVSAGNNG
jgi:hypothetical protein